MRLLARKTIAAMPSFPADFKESSRVTSGKFLIDLHKSCPFAFGGSADVAASVMTNIPDDPDFSREHPEGRDVNWGIREFAMAGAQNGIQLHRGLKTYVGCFLIFSDYMTSIVKNQYQALNERFQNLKKRGFFANPALIYQQKLEDLQKTKERFLLDIDNANKLRQQEVSALKGRLNALSPYGVLGRGYSITSDSNGKILDSIEGVAPGEIVKTQLKDGIIQASVVSKEKKHG